MRACRSRELGGASSQGLPSSVDWQDHPNTGGTPLPAPPSWHPAHHSLATPPPPLYEANYCSETSTTPKCMVPIRLCLKNTIISFLVWSRLPSAAAARGRVPSPAGEQAGRLGAGRWQPVEPVAALAWAKLLLTQHHQPQGGFPPLSPHGGTGPCLLCRHHQSIPNLLPWKWQVAARKAESALNRGAGTLWPCPHVLVDTMVPSTGVVPCSGLSPSPSLGQQVSWGEGSRSRCRALGCREDAGGHMVIPTAG